MVKKWESVADVLPQVVDRLSALKDLHEQGKDNTDIGAVWYGKKWESVADVLPQVVDRLSALKDLHEQGKDNTDI